MIAFIIATDYFGTKAHLWTIAVCPANGSMSAIHKWKYNQRFVISPSPQEYIKGIKCAEYFEVERSKPLKLNKDEGEALVLELAMIMIGMSQNPESVGILRCAVIQLKYSLVI